MDRIELLKVELLERIRVSLSDEETKSFKISGYTRKEIDEVLENMCEDLLFRGIECHSKDGMCWLDVKLTSSGLEELKNYRRDLKHDLIKMIHSDSIGVALIKEDGGNNSLLLISKQKEVYGKQFLSIFKELFEDGYIRHDEGQRYVLTSVGINSLNGAESMDSIIKLKPKERLEIMKETSEILQKNYTSAEIDIFMEGYSIDIKAIKRTTSFSSNRLYVMDILKQQNDDLIVEIHKDLVGEQPTITTIDKKEREIKMREKNNKVFVVHGHDESLKKDVELFLYDLGLEPIILHKQPSRGRTIIEKIEKNTDVKYAIVLYTPDDEGISKNELGKLKEVKLNDRARQNVVFEHGYLMGKLKRENVIHISKGEIEQPTDIGGIVYISENDWKLEVINELKDAGVPIKL